MADVPNPPSETPAAPAAVPAAAAAPSLSGSASFEAQMDAIPPEPVKPVEAKPEAKPAPEPSKPAKVEKAAAKPAAAPTKTVEKPAVTPAVPSLDWKTAPQQFRAAHDKLVEEHTKTKQTLEGQLQQLNQKIAEYDRKQFLTPEQQAHYQAIEKRTQELESNLYSRDYRESPEFADKFEKPWKTKYQNALQEITGLSVKAKDAEGNETSRTATKADFDKVLSISSVTQARRAARELFGEDADVVLQFRNDLNAIEQAGSAAVDEKRSTWNTQQKENFERSKQMGQKNADMMNGYDHALVEKYPQYFGDDPANPEAALAHKSGLQIVDNAVNAQNQSPEDAIKMAATIRRWAAAWPRDQKIIEQGRAKIESLEAELAKYRGSDPGSGGNSTPVESTPKKGGTDAMAAMFDDAK